MSSQSEINEQTIIAILDRLRPFAPAIGSYLKHIYTDEFDYSVKLSNGKIRISEDLVENFGRSPESVSAGQYRQAAGKFVPNEPVVAVPAPLKVRKSFPWRLVAGLVLAAFIGILWAQSASKDDELNFAKANIYNQVSVEGSTYMVNRLLGGISGLRVTVTNNSDYNLDMVNVKVSYIKANGGLYKDEMLHFSQISAHSSQTLDAPDSNRGIKVRIGQESMTCTALNIY